MPVDTPVRAVVHQPETAAPLRVLCLRAGAFTSFFMELMPLLQTRVCLALVGMIYSVNAFTEALYLRT